MTGRHAVLVNLHSRNVRRDPAFLPALREMFQNRGPFLALQNPTELSSAFSEIRKRRTDLLFVCGGDGTLRQTVSELIRAYGNTPAPKIAILKTGTMNTVAAGLGIRSSALSQFRWILERCDRALPLPSQLLRPLAINDSHGFIFAVGGFANFIARYTEAADPSPYRAFWMLTRTTVSALFGTSYSRTLFAPFVADIWKDQKPLQGRTPLTTISASAIRHIGFGFKPYAQAEGPTEEFGTLILQASPRSLVPHLRKIRRGLPIHGSSFEQSSAHEMRIELDRELSPMVDGDLLPPRKEFTLRSGPALDFVTG